MNTKLLLYTKTRLRKFSERVMGFEKLLRSRERLNSFWFCGSLVILINGCVNVHA